MLLSNIPWQKTTWGILLLMGLISSHASYGKTVHHTKSWNTAIITGPIADHPEFQFYLQPWMIFEDTHYKFHSVIGMTGAGYRPKAELTFWLLGGWYYRRRLNGGIHHENQLRGQIDWYIINEEKKLISTTRLERRKLTTESAINWRFRQRITLRMPMACWENHSLVTFEEVFLNLTRPMWVNSRNVYEQNRIFIGIGTRVNPCFSFDLGYLNQYLIKKVHNESNTLLFLSLNVALV